MSKFTIKMKLQGLEIEVEGTKEDAPKIAQQIGKQLSGLLQTPAALASGNGSAGAAVLEGEVVPNEGTGKKQRKPRKAGARTPSETITLVHDATTYGTPLQGWTTVQKAIWFLYIASKQATVTQMTGYNIAKNFNKYFRASGIIHSGNVSPGLEKEKVFFCGVRLGEALAIEWSQVDFSAGLIRLHETKTDEPRVVPLPSILRMLLAELQPKVGRVFDATNLRKEWIEACAACGLGRKIEVEGKPYDPRYEGLTIHDLRRSAVRNLVRAGVAETVAMKISGHKTRSVFDRYAIASESDLRTAMSKVETNGLGETLVKLALPAKSKKSRKAASTAVVALSSRG